MKIGRFVVLCLIVTVCHVSGGSVVVDLTEYSVDEFNLELQNHESIFVKFFTPTCPHCRDMAKDFALVARQLQDQDEYSIVLAEVDCSHDAGEEICSKYGIQGFPTLKLFRYGSFYKNYNAQRKAKTMKQWLLNQVQGSSMVLQSVSDLSALVQTSDDVVVAAVIKSGQMRLLSHFLKASRRVKLHPQFADVRFYHVITDDLPQTVWGSLSKEKPESSVTLYRPRWLQSTLESERVSISLTLKHNITAWVFNQSYGVIAFRTPKTDRNIHDPRSTGPLIVAFYDFDFRNNSEATHLWRDQIVPIANEYPMITFAISRISDYAYYLKSKSLVAPAGANAAPVVIFYDIITVPYVMEEKFSTESLKHFVENTMKDAGGSLPRLRSNSSCPDHVNWTLPCMSAAEFKQKVSLNTKEVLILIYKQMNDDTMKTVMRVSQFLAKVGIQNLESYTLDAFVNEVPHAFESPDYPVIFYVSKKKQVTKIDRKFTEILINELLRQHAKKQQSARKTHVKTEL
jgi:protein disulfide isomerase family A protein 3